MEGKNDVKLYSIIFLDYDPEGKCRQMANDSLASIVVNSRNYDYEIVHVKNVKGFVIAVNAGFLQARGDYLVVVANDVILNDPLWLAKLSEKSNFISSWRFIPFHITGENVPDASCWGLCLADRIKIGFMDDAFKEGYGFDDNDYWVRAENLGIQFYNANINLTHLENKTYSSYFSPEERQAMTSGNHSLFFEKHKDYLAKKGIK